MAAGQIKPNSYKWHIIAIRMSHPNLYYDEIANIVGCSIKTVRSECERHGLCFYGPHGEGRGHARHA